MRVLTNKTITKMQQREGIEPIVVVKLFLNVTYCYGDEIKTINNINFNGKILEVGEIRSEKTSDSMGNIQSISIKLDDTDGSLKNILTSVQFAGRLATVYHLFEGITDLTELLTGTITTPITWSEADRTLSFDIVAKIDSKEIGCFIQEGELTLAGQQVPEGSFDQKIPIVFGTVANVPALKILEPIKGKTGTFFGTYPLTNGYPLIFDYIRVIGGEKFPQNVEIVLYFGSVPISGTMVGDKFYVLQIAPVEGQVTIVQIGGEELLPYSLILNMTDSSNNIIHIAEDNLNLVGKCLVAVQIDQVVDLTGIGLGSDTDLEYEHFYQVVAQDGKKLYLNKRIQFEFNMVSNNVVLYPPADNKLDIRHCAASYLWTKPPNTDVYMNNDHIYAFNCGPTEEVLDVKAFRNDIKGPDDESIKTLASVPEELYTINLAYTVGNKTVSVIILERPLSGVWETDKLYVSLKSALSPNTADVLEYLLTNFTNASIDGESFNKVRQSIENFPSEFALMETGDTLSVCNDIAWQARCALYLSGLKVKLVYLSKEPTNVGSLTDLEIEEATVNMFLTDFEDIVTHLIATYRLDYALDEKDFEKHYRNNITLYGEKKEERQFYIYNNENLIQKSLTFWGIRYSNQWIKFNLSSFLSELQAEVFDAIQLQCDLFSSIKTIIDNISHNTETPGLSYELWTPALAGTKIAFGSAWLSDVGSVKPAPITIKKNFIAHDPQILSQGKWKNPNPSNRELEILLGKIVKDLGGGTALVTTYPNGYENPGQAVIAEKLDPTIDVTKDAKVLVKKTGDRYYIDSALADVDTGLYARAATTEDITLFGTQIIDIVTLLEDDLVLVWKQTDTTKNGIYKVTAADWILKTEFTISNLYKTIFIGQGIIFGGSRFILESGGPVLKQEICHARVATTENSSLYGLVTIDGQNLNKDDVVLVWKQTTVTTNGLYLAKGGTWLKILSFNSYNIGIKVNILSGSIFGNSSFMSTANDTLVWQRETYNAYVATTGNHSLSGPANVDGIPISENLVLVWLQTDPTQNGIYISKSGTWVKVLSFNTLGTKINVTAGNILGRTSFSVIATNSVILQKESFRVYAATTVDHTLTGTLNVDGQFIADEDLILVWKQNTSSNNGIYIVKSSGSWVRISSVSTTSTGIIVTVMNGTLYGRLTLTQILGGYTLNGAVFL